MNKVASIIALLLALGCARHDPILPPTGTDLTGEWLPSSAMGATTLCLTHLGTNLSGSGLYVTEFTTATDTPFMVVGSIRTDVVSRAEIVTLHFTPNEFPFADSNQTYRVEHSLTVTNVLLLRSMAFSRFVWLNRRQVEEAFPNLASDAPCLTPKK
jgi:hypothetical protein